MIYLLCGKAGSGKTTLARKLACPMLSCDELVIRLFGHYLGDKHSEITQKCTTYLLDMAASMHEKGCDVALDFGFWTKKSREETRRFFKMRGIPCVLWYLCPREEVRCMRLEKRNEDIRNGIIQDSFTIDSEFRESLDARFEEPDKNEIDVIMC